jgi:hypothetical protein
MAYALPGTANINWLLRLLPFFPAPSPLQPHRLVIMANALENHKNRLNRFVFFFCLPTLMPAHTQRFPSTFKEGKFLEGHYNVPSCLLSPHLQKLYWLYLLLRFLSHSSQHPEKQSSTPRSTIVTTAGNTTNPHTATAAIIGPNNSPTAMA